MRMVAEVKPPSVSAAWWSNRDYVCLARVKGMSTCGPPRLRVSELPASMSWNLAQKIEVVRFHGGVDDAEISGRLAAGRIRAAKQ